MFSVYIISIVFIPVLPRFIRFIYRLIVPPKDAKLDRTVPIKFTLSLNPSVVTQQRVEQKNDSYSPI